jgi:hypothetical protein
MLEETTESDEHARPTRKGSDMSDPIPSCFDCANAPTERLVEMFVGIAQQRRIKLGQTPAERPVFRKLHGVAHGRLEMLPVFHLT